MTLEEACAPEPVESLAGIAVRLRRAFSEYVGRDEVDDLSQQAWLGFVMAADRFDPSRGVKFTTLAWQYALGEIKHYVRDQSGLLMRPRRAGTPLNRRISCASIDSTWEREDGSRLAIADVVPDRKASEQFDLAEALADVSRALRSEKVSKRNPRKIDHARVVAMLAGGYTQLDAARAAGCTQRSVSRIKGALSRTLRRAALLP